MLPFLADVLCSKESKAGDCKAEHEAKRWPRWPQNRRVIPKRVDIELLAPLGGIDEDRQPADEIIKEHLSRLRL